MCYLLKTGKYHCYITERFQEPKPNHYIFSLPIFCTITKENQRHYFDLTTGVQILKEKVSWDEAVEFLRTYHESERYDSVSNDEMWYCVKEEQEKFENELKELGLSMQ